MEKQIKELYFNYEAILDNLTFLAPLIIEKNNLNKQLLEQRNEYYHKIEEIIEVIKEYKIDDEFNDEKIKDLNEKIAKKLLDLGYAYINENDEIELKVDPKKSPVKNIDEVLTAIRTSERNKRYLYNNAVVNCVTAYEQFIYFIFNSFYTKNKGIVENKSLTLDDLKQLGSIDDAINYLICKETKDIMYGSVEDWHKKLKAIIKIKTDYYEKNQKKIDEYFQRRNVIVHNNSVINSIYLKSITDSPFKIDDNLESTFEYIQEMQKYLFLDAFYISVQTIYKLLNDKKIITSIISTFGAIAFENMKQKNWDIAKEIYEDIKDRKKITKEHMEMYKLNWWLCRDNMNDELVIKEIEEDDFSDKSKFLQIGYYSLLFDKEKIIDLFTKGIDEIKLEQLEEWPIFYKVRDDSEFYNKVREIIKD